MLTRRDVLRSLAGAGALSVAYPVMAGCGSSNPSGATPPGAGLAVADLARLKGDPHTLPPAVLSVQHLSAGLYRGLARTPGNLVCSPYSVAVALAMTRNGARGRTAAEMDDVLHASGGTAYNAGMNALTQQVESHAGLQKRLDGSKATVSLDVANSLWGQQDTRWQQPFLDALARYYGTGMRLVDYVYDAEDAARLINAWTADHTEDQIAQILPPGVLNDLTRLVLVNAIYLKAPWEEPFFVKGTTPQPFRRADGTTVRTDTMHGSLRTARYGRGNGWQAARLLYAGRQLAMTVIVPDEPDLGELEQSLDGPALARLLGSVEPVDLLELTLPRWKFRFSSLLNPTLAGLGMVTAFSDQADFSAMTSQEQLQVSAVLHEAFIAVDEQGTQAAAATAVTMIDTAMPIPVAFDVDRTFLFVIHDVETAAPLFIGRVDDPTTS